MKDLKSLEFNHRPSGGFGIGFSMKVSGQPTPIRQYREKNLETEVVCDRCTLRYTIYGVFGFCPDCAVHNSLQILNKNLELVQKLLAVAETQESRVAQHLIENTLEDCVSAFDGFGRETCRVFASKAVKPEELRDKELRGTPGGTPNSGTPIKSRIRNTHQTAGRTPGHPANCELRNTHQVAGSRTPGHPSNCERTPGELRELRDTHQIPNPEHPWTNSGTPIKLRTPEHPSNRHFPTTDTAICP